MYQSNHKLSNLKNLEHNGARSLFKPMRTESFPVNESTTQPYVPHDDFEYMNHFQASDIKHPLGIRPENAFPVKEEWLSTAEKDKEPEDFGGWEKLDLNSPEVTIEPKLNDFFEGQEYDFGNVEFGQEYQE